ncbi:MAG TPA: 30S ribosomal protein S4 [Thermoplasmata archaeon]|nr:30S ribosomal protein S4 [Thermoplasmata archaeon]
MGDPKFLRRTYDTPKHPWEAGRMAEERKLLDKYGLKNKRELWKAQSILRGFRGQARELQARLRAGEPQAQRETANLLARLTRLGVLPVGNPTIDDVLALTTEDLLRRRFEWVVFHRNLAPTANGARQWIVHGHFAIGDHRVTRPGYLVPSAEEPLITYSPSSPLADEDHAVRAALRERLNARPAPEPVAPPTEEGGA